MDFKDYEKEYNLHRKPSNKINQNDASEEIKNDLQVLQKSEPIVQKSLQFEYANKNNYVDLEVLQSNLGNCLHMIDNEVMKGYVTKLNSLPSVKPDSSHLNALPKIHFFKITEMVYNKDEFSLHNLSTMFQSLANLPCTLVLMIKSDGTKNDFYLGVRSNSQKNSSGTMMKMLKQSFQGVFTGSKVCNYYDEEMKSDMDKIKSDSISCVTCVADYKQADDKLSNKDFTQGLEKFIYSMKGKPYTAIFIANNVEYNNLMTIRNEFEQIYTNISPFANMQFNFSVNSGKTTSNSYSEGNTRTNTIGKSEGENSIYSHGNSTTYGENSNISYSEAHGTNNAVSNGTTHSSSHADGISNSKSYTDSINHTTGTSSGTSSSTGVSVGRKVSVNKSRSKFSSKFESTSKGHSDTYGTSTSKTDSVSDAISKTLSYGVNDTNTEQLSYGDSTSFSNTDSVSIGIQSGTNYSLSEAFNLVNSQTLTNTFGDSQGITLEAKNKTLLSTLERLEKHLDRLDECESIGMWNFATYFLGETIADTQTAASTYRSVVSGTDSGLERSAINTWTDDKDLNNIRTYIKNFVHPEFLHTRFSYRGSENIVVNPAVLVSTNELAIHMCLPRYSVIGLPVTEHAPFAQEIISNHNKGNLSLRIGKIFHLGERTNIPVELDIESLAMHTFITGSTGSGKSSTIFSLLDSIMKKPIKDEADETIKFLVIEPAKGEYKHRFGNYKNVSVYGTNINKTPLLRINPFSFPDDVHVLEHIDRLIEIFNVCWAMYAAMPAVLKDAIEQAYVSAGWDLQTSKCKYKEAYGKNIYPSFIDVLEQINIIVDSSHYSTDSKGDYKGALCTRVKSLSNGLYGQIFSNNEISPKKLFDENVIIDLSRVGSCETKALIMGILIIKLQEYRMSDESGYNHSLRHLTVLEEAHNILKRTSTEQSTESANLLGKSVEMISNSIAEMRTYGEGFVIVDQSPGLMDMSVIRNTNTKIILRLPDYSDRELVGKSANLRDEQITEISRLDTFVATIYQNNWLEPVLCKIKTSFPKEDSFYKFYSDKILPDIDNTSEKFLNYIVKAGNFSEIDITNLKESILKTNVSAIIKILFAECCNTFGYPDFPKFFKKLVYAFFNAPYAIGKAEHCTDINQWKTVVINNLYPSIDHLNELQIDVILGNILSERALFDSSYHNLLKAFTEQSKKSGVSGGII